MPRTRGLTFTEQSLLGLFYIQRYRSLTIDQYARATDQRRATASDQLRALERHGLLGHFGNVGQGGRGSTPKVYYLKRKGHEALLRESDIPPELIGSHKETFTETQWSPKMYHRIRTVDLMIAIEEGVRRRSHLSLVRTFLEFRRVKRGTRIERETTDYVAEGITADNRIIPDAAFILENVTTGRRALFFIEMDMATERIVTQITRDRRITIHHKITQYDRYLLGRRFAQTYSPWGQFPYFCLLFVTFGAGRVENIRREMHDLPTKLASFYHFATFEEAVADPLGPIWKTRSPTDNERKPIVR